MNIHAQIKQTVNWQYHVDKIANNEYEAVLSAKIEKGWHLDSKDLPKDSGIIEKKGFKAEAISE